MQMWPSGCLGTSPKDWKGSEAPPPAPQMLNYIISSIHQTFSGNLLIAKHRDGPKKTLATSVAHGKEEPGHQIPLGTLISFWALLCGEH